MHPATGANALAVAEYVLASLLVLFRGAYQANARMLDGSWPRADLQGRETWTPVAVDPDLPGNAHAAVLVNGPALARLVGTVSPAGYDPLGSAVAAILGDLRSVGVGAWYEEDSVRVRGRVRLARN